MYKVARLKGRPLTIETFVRVCENIPSPNRVFEIELGVRVALSYIDFRMTSTIFTSDRIKHGKNGIPSVSLENQHHFYYFRLKEIRQYRRTLSTMHT